MQQAPGDQKGAEIIEAENQNEPEVKRQDGIAYGQIERSKEKRIPQHMIAAGQNVRFGVKVRHLPQIAPRFPLPNSFNIPDQNVHEHARVCSVSEVRFPVPNSSTEKSRASQDKDERC